MVQSGGGLIQLQVTVRFPRDLQPPAVRKLQEGIETSLVNDGLGQQVRLKLTLIDVKIIEPVAPTPTIQPSVSIP